MPADLRLKQAQSFWETPKAIAIIVATTAGVFTAAAGLAGYKFAQTQTAPTLQQIVLPPGTVIQIPGAQK